MDKLAALNGEAAGLCAARRYAEAIPLFERALEGCEATLGDRHVATLTVAGNLAVAQVAGGQRRAGMKRLAANLADRARLLGDEDARTLSARDALAVALRLAGDADQAVAVSTRVAEQRRRVLGATHPDTLTSRMGLALALLAAADTERAMSVLTVAMNDAERALGPQHPHTLGLLECASNIGLVRRDK
jgi:tetratricopeptide (TPR) repeat protein